MSETKIAEAANQERTADKNSALKDQIMSLGNDKFGFAADMMGRSEQELKNDTYRNYIKTFMRKIGKIYEGSDVSAEQIEADMALIQKFNGLGMALTPIYFDVVKDIRKRLGFVPVDVVATVGYPSAISTVKAMQTDMDICLSYGADGTIMVFPTATIALNQVAAVEEQYAKIARKSKKLFGLAINPDFSEEYTKKLFELINETQISSVTLLGEGLEAKVLSKFVKTVCDCNVDKEIKVFCSLKTFDDISVVLKSGAAKIYTTCFEELGEELVKEFNVQL